MSEVRFARADDLPVLVDLGRQIHVQSRYAWMQFNAARLWNNLEAAIDNKQHCLIVATSRNGEASTQAESDKLIGVLWAYAVSLSFSSDFIAQIDHLYVLPRYRGTPVAMKMMAGLRRWANNRQVSELLLANAFGSEQAYSGKWLGKLGLKSIGGMHSMWMDRQ
jgi:GNAT superfamily N-acetyltransferase